jgi:hypothetical protein
MRNRFSPGCTTWVLGPETAVVGVTVGTDVVAAGADVGTGVDVGTAVGGASTAIVGIGVAGSRLGVGVRATVAGEVGLGETTRTTVCPVGAVAVAVGTVCTSETTAGLARLQPAIRTTRSKAKTSTARIFFFMLISSFEKSNGNPAT